MDISGKFLDEYGTTPMEEEEIKIMNDWVKLFKQRYDMVGRIASSGTKKD